MKKVSDIATQIVNDIKNEASDSNKPKGLCIGFESIDEFTHGLNGGDLIVLASRPEVGKTTLALQIALNVSSISKKTVAYFSFENSNEELAQRLLGISSGIDSNMISKEKILRHELDQIISGAKNLINIPIYINDNHGLLLPELYEESLKLKNESNLDLIIVESLGFIIGDKELNTRRSEQIDKILEDLKKMAREINCPIILLSALSKSVDTRPNKRPTLKDFIIHSHAVKEIADIILFIYREDVYVLSSTSPTPLSFHSSDTSL